jgi:CheY-like chemotaxis protein
MVSCINKSHVQKIQCFEAENGKEAIDVFTREHIDAIIMDCKMPVLDGIAATRVLLMLTDFIYLGDTKVRGG